MILLAAGNTANAPPALVVNENVAAAPVLPASLCVCTMVNVGLVTLSPIRPESMVVGLALASAVVLIEIEVAPEFSGPMVSPLSVMVTAVLAAMDEAVSVSTMAVVVGATLVAVTPLPLIAAVGMADVAKKPLG